MTRNRASAKKAGSLTRSQAALKASRVAASRLLATPLADRIRDSSSVTESGCWQWQRYTYGNGYAAISVAGKQRLAHRVSYEVSVGPIPEGMVIDHLCRNKRCVNPAHLEVVTSRENTRRAMRTHCINGHEFDEENTWMHEGKRYCRACRRKRAREYQERRRHA